MPVELAVMLKLQTVQPVHHSAAASQMHAAACQPFM